MKFNIRLPAIALFIRAMTTVSTAATAQARAAEGRRTGKVNRTQAAGFTRQASQLQARMNHLNRKQGFVSAAELASYNRTQGEVDVALDSYDAPRSYGSDGLVSPNAQ